jgi:hypothetical protein
VAPSIFLRFSPLVNRIRARDEVFQQMKHPSCWSESTLAHPKDLKFMRLPEVSIKNSKMWDVGRDKEDGGRVVVWQ